ncbi:hypothetical protein BJ912DRAFT_841467 [Pholiota molesta]|nr:hypothetical protein BJ912DRAFT_841467 [Pholiota molesta]
MDSLIPFTTSGSLVDCVDRKMLVILRDGRKLHGVLRSYDQFANLVLEDTVERIYHGNAFAESWHGLFLIRGENVVLLGEIDLDREEDVPLKQVDFNILNAYHKQEAEAKKEREDSSPRSYTSKKGFAKKAEKATDTNILFPLISHRLNCRILSSIFWSSGIYAIRPRTSHFGSCRLDLNTTAAQDAMVVK